jgi:hypothetical protein
MPVVTREQVLKLLQQGKSIDEIQAITKASKGAVKVHIRRLKDTGRWSEPQATFPAEQPIESATKVETTRPQEVPQSIASQLEPCPERVTESGNPLIFRGKKEFIDFLVSRLLEIKQETKEVSDSKKLIAQKDYEIGILREQVDALQAELTRIKAGIAALK